MDAGLTCNSVEALLWRRIDGELVAGDEPRLEEHLAGCEGCAAALEELGRLDGLIEASLSVHPFDEAFTRHIISGVRESQRCAAVAADQRPLVFRLAPAIALAAAILLGFFLGLGNSGVERPGKAAQRVIAKAQGALSVMRNGRWEALQRGQPICHGELVKNISDGPASLVFLGKSRVTLRPDSAAIIRRQGRKTEVDLRHGGGEVLCSVRKRQGRFTVIAHDMKVEVVGTKFLVRSFPSLSRVTVLEGEVLCSRMGRSWAVRAQQESEPTADAFLLRRAAIKHRTHWLAASGKLKGELSPSPTRTKPEPWQGPSESSNPEPSEAESPTPSGLDMPMEHPRDPSSGPRPPR